jgi:hypothetical protein
VADFPHLPPGHEPGAQSLRNRMGLPLLWWFVGIVGIGMFLGGVFIVAGGRGPGFNFWEERIGGTVFGGMGLFCAGVAYWQYRLVRPVGLSSRLRGVNLAVERDDVRRGEVVTVTLDHPQSAKDLEVGLVCVEAYDLQSRTQTKAGVITVRQTSRANAYEHWQGVEPAAGEQTFSLEIPSDAPYSYEGDCISFAWRVSARRVRTMRADPRVDHPIWVQP